MKCREERGEKSGGGSGGGEERNAAQKTKYEKDALDTQREEKKTFTSSNCKKEEGISNYLSVLRVVCGRCQTSRVAAGRQVCYYG